MSKLSFNQRFSVGLPKPIEQEFPESGRVALAYLINELADMNSIRGCGSYPMINEMLRTSRLVYTDFDFDRHTVLFYKIVSILKRMEWWQVYTFCERFYEKHIDAAANEYEDSFVETQSKAEVQSYFEIELNNILNEENVSYQFVSGQFQHRGRAQTQKSIQRVGSILADPHLSAVLQHYNKARKFFDARPQADVENCVKEAICAFEAAVHVLTNLPASTDFVKAIKQIQGNEPRQIPPPVAEGMIRIYAYRGSGQGVAHAALHGNRVTELEAELVLIDKSIKRRT